MLLHVCITNLEPDPSVVVIVLSVWVRETLNRHWQAQQLDPNQSHVSTR